MRFALKLPNFKKNGRFLGFGSSAKRDWKIIFFVAVGLLLIMFGVAVYMFIAIDKGAVSTDVAPSTSEVPITSEMLKRVTSYYQGKVPQLETIKTTKETVADPSL